MSEFRPHQWIDRPEFLAVLDRDGVKTQVCRLCGVVRRADGKYAECRGLAKVALREGLGFGGGSAVEGRPAGLTQRKKGGRTAIALPPLVKASTMIS